MEGTEGDEAPVPVLFCRASAATGAAALSSTTSPAFFNRAAAAAAAAGVFFLSLSVNLAHGGLIEDVLPVRFGLSSIPRSAEPNPIILDLMIASGDSDECGLFGDRPDLPERGGVPDGARCCCCCCC